MQFLPFLFLILIILLSGLRQVNQYERGVKFTMGRFTKMVDPGWRLVIPVFQSMQKVDLRLKAVDVPSQDAITKDNVKISIDGIMYFRVNDPVKASYEVK